MFKTKVWDIFLQNVYKVFNANEQVTVHWNGKFMKDLGSHKYVDRLLIVLSG